MIKNVIFDFGCVLIHWDQHNLYDSYFGSKEKTDWFVDNICTWEWNNQTDVGKSFAESVAEKVAEFPEWEKEIRMYWDRWKDMIGGEVAGMKEWIHELKAKGYGVYGLTNWSSETFPLVKDKFSVFGMMDGIVMSGEEMISKPDLRIYQILLDRYGLKAEECVFIDDRKSNTEAGEKLGFLPGDMRDKIDPYLQPLYDALEDMIPAQKLREMMEQNIIQIAPLAFMRGRTLNDAVVILDEAQNTTSAQIKMFLTRMGCDAKFIVTGDASQIDLPNKKDSGLLKGIELTRNIKGIKTITFKNEDIVRHPLVAKIVKAFEKGETAE